MLKSSFGWITPDFLRLKMRYFQGIIFRWINAYKEIFKSAFQTFKAKPQVSKNGVSKGCQFSDLLSVFWQSCTKKLAIGDK